MAGRRTFVIVGGGLAGATAALTLRREGFDGRIVVLCEEKHPPYSRPPLSKALLRGEIAPEKAHLRPAKVWESNEVELVLGCVATELRPAEHQVILAGGATLAYDKLLIATGGRPRTLPGTEGIDGVLTLRTLDDALVLRSLLAEGRSLAVVGAGFIGAEVAASAVAVGAPVTVLEALPLPLSHLLPPSLGQLYARLHRERGVVLRTGEGVERVRAAGSGVDLTGTAGTRLRADVALVAIGIELDLRLASSAGLVVGNGIAVDEFCRTSVPDVYAAGDIAEHPNLLLGQRVRIEHWQNAQHQGAAAARNMLGAGEPFREVPWVWSEQYELTLQVAGMPEPGDRVVVRGEEPGTELAAFLLRDGRLAAVVGINRPDEVRAGRTMIASGITPAVAELDDPKVDLDALMHELAIA